MMIRITTYDTRRIAAMIWFDIATKPSWNACSVSVSVSASEFLNTASTWRAIAAPSSGFATPSTNTPTWPVCFGVRWRTVSFRYSQWNTSCRVIVESSRPWDAAHDEIPRAG